MKPTNRCRLGLLLSPMLVPALLAMSVFEAFVHAVIEFSEALGRGVTDDCRFWYREVYRPARYGSVFD